MSLPHFPSAKQDNLFKQNANLATDSDGRFKFSKAVAEAFPDMAKRSIPYYYESSLMAAEIGTHHLQNVYKDYVPDSGNATKKRILTNQHTAGVVDCGCSWGNFSLLLRQAILRKRSDFFKDERDNNLFNARTKPAEISILGVDSSKAMIAEAKQASAFASKLEQQKSKRSSNIPNPAHLKFKFQQSNITTSNFFDLLKSMKKKYPIHLMGLLYTLQFLPMEEKRLFLKKLQPYLSNNAMLIVSEKTSMPKPSIVSPENKVQEKREALHRKNVENFFHSDMFSFFFKQHDVFRYQYGYNANEVKRKTDALQSVLHSISFQELTKLFKETGFSEPIIFFQWYHFISFVSFKL